MSFNVICSACGSLSGPSVGICPFCKTTMVSKVDAVDPSSASVSKFFEEGRLDLALTMARALVATKSEVAQTPQFLVLYARILIDTEAPSSLIQSILAEAHMHAPDQQEILDYIELIGARSALKKGPNDAGELALKALLRRSPSNPHAHFFLGSHFYWDENQPLQAIPHLESCVRLSPNFLRAWGCLGAIYRELGNKTLAIQAFQKCLDLEHEGKMKSFFAEQIAGLKSA